MLKSCITHHQDCLWDMYQGLYEFLTTMKNIVILYDIGNLWTAKSDHFLAFPWNDCRTNPIIKKRFFIVCKILMLHFIGNFENSLIISSKNVSLIFQFDFYCLNKFISFIVFIFNRPLCIERDHSKKDRKRIRYFTLQFYSWVNQMTALFAKGEAVLIFYFDADSPELIRIFSTIESL